MPVPKLEDLEGSIFNSRSQVLLQIRKELTIMLRKALTLGMVFILALSLLLVSMVTCFTYDAQADDKFICTDGDDVKIVDEPIEEDGWSCSWFTHGH